MYPQVLSWLRDTAKLTLGYLGVGLCFSMAGIVAAVLQIAGLKSTISIALALVLGFSASLLFWKWFQRTALTVTVP